MDLLQEYKELYHKEIEHSERLNERISKCITYLTILGSAQILLWTQLKNFEIVIYTLIYFIGCLSSLILFGVSVYKFYRAYSGYKYNYFPIKEMAIATIQTYEIAGHNKKDIKKANNHVYNMYCERYLNDAISNRQNNEIKNKRHKKLINFLCISFILTALVFAYGVVIDFYEIQIFNCSNEVL